MANVVPVGALYKHVPHRKKVLQLYRKALLHLKSFCMYEPLNVWSYESTVLRARFDAHKLETDPKKAAMLLRLGEEEFWLNQHPFPSYYPNSAQFDGPLFQRNLTHQRPNAVFDTWSAEDKAHFPDYFAKRDKWYRLRKEVWEDEMKCLYDFDKQQMKANIPMTDELPAANTKDGYPPFWWRSVSRPLEHPTLMTFFPYKRDHGLLYM